MKPLNHSFQTVNLFAIDGAVIDKLRPEHDQNEHFYAICCRPEVGDDVASGRNVETIEDYLVVSFEVDSSSSSRDIPPKIIS